MADEPTPYLEALQDGTTYGLPDAPVETITTHAAHVFLVGERAYKIKRPVRYSFLDFTTAGARYRALAHELTLNRAIAPQLYRGLVPLVERADGTLRVLGEDEAAPDAQRIRAWLLMMRRFPQNDLLSAIAARGALTPELCAALGARIAEIHRDAPVEREVGGFAGMDEVVCGNAEDLARSAPEVFAAETVDAYNTAAHGTLQAARDLLERRREADRVRFCHGDLHLGNIVMLDGAPVPFDRIEFNDAFAQIDVLYDLAFLLMDTHERGHRRQAQACLQGYIEHKEDDAGLALLPLFLSCRAAIRAKVEAFAAQTDAAQADARRYLAAAHAYLRPAAPRLLAIGGLSGTGKTTLARELAWALGAAPGAVILRSDVIRKRLHGVAPTERLPASAYRSKASARVYRTLEARATHLLVAGHSVIVDAVWGNPTRRQALAELAAHAGVPFHGLWLTAPLEVLLERVRQRHGDASDADAAVVRQQWRGLAGHQPAGWQILDARAPATAHAERLRATFTAQSSG